jgi:hypothetical protein
LALKYYTYFSHHLEKLSKTNNNKEFKIPNHVAGTSVDSAAYSLPTFHITPHIITKLEDKIRFPRAYF